MKKRFQKSLIRFLPPNAPKGGSGLGMHIVHNLVTQTLGGTISCKSEPGNGIMLRIQIPMTGEQKDPAAHKSRRDERE